MSKVKSKDTKPELILRKKLWEKGIKNYRTNSKLFGKPDLVFSKSKVAIFIDGCFWHKCPYHFREPKSHIDYWAPKISLNVRRKDLVNRRLKKEGWKVIRIWEHSIKSNLDNCILRIVFVLENR